MFVGRKRTYFVDYFCTEMATRTGACPPEARLEVEKAVDRAIAEIKRLGLASLDTPLGEAVVDPEGPAGRKALLIHSFASRWHGENAARWRAEGVTPSEVAAYWNHGVLSHLCYTEFDSYFNNMMLFSILQYPEFAERDFTDLDEAIAAAHSEFLKQWPLYGPVREPHLKMEECDRPLPVETRHWVDQFRFRGMTEDPEEFQDLLGRYSSFNAFARFARARNPALAAELSSNGLPAPAVVLVPLSASDQFPVILDDEEDMGDPDAEDHDETAAEDELFDNHDGPDDAHEDETIVSNRYINYLVVHLRWPIPIRLGDEVKDLYARDLLSAGEASSEFVTIPCALLDVWGRLQVSGVLVVAWLEEPHSDGLHLCVDFVQNEAIDAGEERVLASSVTQSVDGYIVDASAAGYTHRSEFQTIGYRERNFAELAPDLGLRTTSLDGEDKDIIIPWSTGVLSETEKETILDRLKTVLELIDRQLALHAAGQRSTDRDPYSS